MKGTHGPEQNKKYLCSFSFLSFVPTPDNSLVLNFPFLHVVAKSCGLQLFMQLSSSLITGPSDGQNPHNTLSSAFIPLSCLFLESSLYLIVSQAWWCFRGSITPNMCYSPKKKLLLKIHFLYFNEMKLIKCWSDLCGPASFSQYIHVSNF